VLNGTTIECGAGYPALVYAVRQGLIAEANITTAVKKLVQERFWLRIFDPPDFVPFTKIPYSIVQNPAHGAHAPQMARESIVSL
jgi:beta-glucosidase